MQEALSDDEENEALFERAELGSDGSDLAPPDPETDPADEAPPVFDNAATTAAPSTDGAADPNRPAAPARPLADEFDALVCNLMQFLERTRQMIRQVPDNHHVDVHRMYQGMRRLAGVREDWTFAQCATHISQFREPSDLLDHTNIPHHGRAMNGRKKQNDQKRKRGDAATGHGQCNNRGRRRARIEEEEEEPEDLPKEIPEQGVAPQGVPASQSSIPARLHSPHLVAAAPAAAAPVPATNAPHAAPASGPITQATAPVVEISDEQLTALVARLYGRR